MNLSKPPEFCTSHSITFLQYENVSFFCKHTNKNRCSRKRQSLLCGFTDSPSQSAHFGSLSGGTCTLGVPSTPAGTHTSNPRQAGSQANGSEPGVTLLVCQLERGARGGPKEPPVLGNGRKALTTLSRRPGHPVHITSPLWSSAPALGSSISTTAGWIVTNPL